uniref:uncharacterized protein LOC109958963 n=1 Tax=Monopterus albus TaxID=43700 RepID=UPI0009B4C8B7|nr:uncharacterized protein LOC109958963 [Monopterus albus]
MSAQRKNKRLGSRRRVANQNEIPEADVLHVTDNPIAQPHIPEENSGFLNLLCNPDKSQSEPQCPPEPANRRKLGSRRKNKERQHVKDSATESYYEPENESEEKTRGREAVETALSLMSQSEKQEQSSHRSVHDMSATADSSLCSGTTHGYEFQNSTLKGNSLMNESHVESVVVGFSTTAEMATDENSPRQNTELEYGTEAATTEELPPDEDQNEHFFLPLEPQPEDNSVSIDLQTNTDFNPVGNRRKLGSSRRSKGSQPVKDSIANLYHKAQDEVVENVRANEAIEIAKMSLLVETEVLTDTHQTKTPGSPVRETEHLVGISDLNNSSLHPSLAFNQQLIGQSNVREKPDELPDVYCVTEKDTTERDDDTDLLLQWGILQANYLVSESHMKSESIEPSITVITTERKSPGEHTEPESVGEQAVEISPKKLTMEENDHFELAQVSRGQHSENTVNKVHGQEVKPTQRQEHDSSLHSASTPSYSSEVQIPTPTNCPEADLDCLIPNIQTDVKVEMSVESLEATLEGMDKSDTLQSEDEGVNHSQDAVNTICEQVVKAEQMQELHDIHYYFQSIKHDTAENSDNCSVNLKTQDELRHAYQSELTVKNTDSASKQEVSNPSKQDDHHTTENKIQALDQINEDFHVYDNEKPHTSDIEGLDTAISQVYEIKGQGEDNIMPSAGQTSDQEKENNGENEAKLKLKTHTNLN